MPEVTQELNVRTKIQTLAQKPASLRPLGRQNRNAVEDADLASALGPGSATDEASDHGQVVYAASTSLGVLTYKMGSVNNELGG